MKKLKWKYVRRKKTELAKHFCDGFGFGIVVHNYRGKRIYILYHRYNVRFGKFKTLYSAKNKAQRLWAVVPK